MNLLRVRSMLEEARYRHRRRQGRGRSSSSDTSESINSTPSIPSQRSDITARAALSDAELLQRARAAYASEDFASLAGGPAANGPWVRVEAVDRFVVFQRPAPSSNNLEVLCAGRLDASLEEVASILRSNSEGELNCAMSALYSKSFIFGSYEREISCADKNQTQDDGDSDGSEHLAVKTKSFARTSVLGRNEQWCYFDYFRRKSERDGFTVTKRALPASEPIPGRITERSAHVEQLHGLSASYLVDKPPDQKGLRVVFRAWFEPLDNALNQPQDTRSSSSRQSSSSSSSSSSGSKSTTDRGDTRKFKAQLRRLLSMARGITHLPKIVRRRRFGVQVPADLSAIRAQNTRCPCCTHSLAPLKLSLSIAASAIATRSLAHVKMATRRCYLCGYFVCANCWTAEHMESAAGRIAAIVVCTRCHANVQACEYSEVFASRNERHRGPPRVIEDLNNSSTASLLIDALNDCVLTAATGSAKHAATMNVIRTLLRQNSEDEEGDPQQTTPRFEPLDDSEAVTKLNELLTGALPILGDCTLGNAERRCYTIDLPDNPNTGVPRSQIPSNEAERVSALKASGLLRLANRLAPEVPQPEPKPDTYDLELLCQLAAKTLDCAYSFVAIMCAKHEHFMAASQPGIAGAVIPREHTTCQHALMSPDPFVAAHHGADVRLHRTNTTVQFGIRFYVGFPLILAGTDDAIVGMFCCIDSKPRAEITRTQYATMKRLANAATGFLLEKCRETQQPRDLRTVGSELSLCDCPADFTGLNLPRSVPPPRDPEK